MSATAESRLQTAARHLNFGPWSAELKGDELAHIRHRGLPVLRGLRAVIRNHNWLTLTPVLSASHAEESAGSLRLVLDVAWKGHSARYAGRVTLLFEAESITVLFQGRAVEDVACNRVGLVVLHRPDDAGRPVTVTSPGGSTTDTAFPAHINPHQPFKNIMALDWERDSVGYRLDFEGDVFETEDQRNWTDASFKTYSTPLSEPFPVTHRAGDTVRQSVRLSARQVIRITDEKSAAVPALGTSAGGTATPAPSLSSPLPAEFAPLLAEVALESDPGMGVISAAEAARLSAAMNLNLDARIIAATPEDALAILRELPLDRVERLAVYDSITHVTQKNLWDAITTEAKELGFQGHLIAGARSHFTELNRNRHSACPEAAAVTYSITPQMHASEPEAIVETLAMHALTAEDALRISNGRALHIGPVTLARRFNAVATEPPLAEELPAYDMLQDTSFAAAWLLGSVTALTRKETASIYYATASELETPAGKLLQQLASHRGSDVLATDMQPAIVAVYPVRTPEGTLTYTANLTGSAVAVRILGPSGADRELALAPWQTSTTLLT